MFASVVFQHGPKLVISTHLSEMPTDPRANVLLMTLNLIVTLGIFAFLNAELPVIITFDLF